MEQLKLKEEPELYAFQEKIKDELLYVLDNSKKTPVLAMATGSGKTNTIIFAIRDMLIKDPSLKLVILTHGQTVLRSNMVNRIKSLGFPEIRLCAIEPGKSIDLDANVFVGLPVGFTNVSKRTSFKAITPKYVITDEAHDWVGKSTHTQVLKMFGNPRQILMTASHGELDPMKKKKLHKIFFSLTEVYNEGKASNVVSVGVNTNWDFSNKLYNNDNNLKSTSKFSKKEVVDALKDLLVDMDRHFRYKGPFSSHDEYPRKPFLKHTFPKTVIACFDIKMANTVHKYFSEMSFGNKVVISHSERSDDYKIEDFDKSDNLLLIVVNRARIGLDAPSVRCLVDMTGTKNVAIMMQLIGRVARVHPDPKITDKVYFKVMPQEQQEYNRHLVSASMTLSTAEEYRLWDGIAPEKITRVVREKRKRKSDDNGRTRNPNSNSEPDQAPLDLKTIAAKGFDLIKYTASKFGQPAEDFCYTTLHDFHKFYVAEKNGGVPENTVDEFVAKLRSRAEEASNGTNH